jgi:hypothetical protein
MAERALVLDSDLESLESLWDEGLGDAYHVYLAAASRRGPQAGRVALAAALVESAVLVQCLGDTAAEPAALLLADLCLARSSRLLAEAADQRLQIIFALTVERVAAAAAGGQPFDPVRGQLLAAVGDRS